MHVLSIIATLLLSVVDVAALISSPPGCAYDNCFWKSSIPKEWVLVAQEFCTSVVGASRGTRCYTTTTVTATTIAFYHTRRPASSKVARLAEASGENLIDRDGMPSFVTANCGKPPTPSQLKAACDCFLATAENNPSSPTKTATGTQTKAEKITSTACKSVTTVTSYLKPSSCGYASPSKWTKPTSGLLPSCTPASPSPSFNGRLRIESPSEGTIFEGCILSGPRNITTSQGGTHLCDGTNYNQNPTSGTTPTDQLDSASRLNNFPYDGPFYPSFDDFLITSISTTTNTNSSYWGIAVNSQDLSVGGCQYELKAGDSTLWSFGDSTHTGNDYLRVKYDWAVVSNKGGDPVAQILNGNGQPVAGAKMEGNPGEESDAQGLIRVKRPRRPGCYAYKAVKEGLVRSNAFWVTNLEGFEGRGVEDEEGLG